MSKIDVEREEVVFSTPDELVAAAEARRRNYHAPGEKEGSVFYFERLEKDATWSVVRVLEKRTPFWKALLMKPFSEPGG